jgi:hypothetical protein
VGKIAEMDVTASIKLKIVLWGLQSEAVGFFPLERGYLKMFCLNYVVWINLLASEICSTKVRILYFFHCFFYIFYILSEPSQELNGELNGDDERLADFRLKCHPHLHAVLPGFD